MANFSEWTARGGNNVFHMEGSCVSVHIMSSDVSKTVGCVLRIHCLQTAVKLTFVANVGIIHRYDRLGDSGDIYEPMFKN